MTRHVPVRKTRHGKLLRTANTGRLDRSHQRGYIPTRAQGSVCDHTSLGIHSVNMREILLTLNRYERVLRHMQHIASSEEWTKAKKLLGWMVCAKRRLTWKEIQVALSIDVDEQTIEYDDRHLRKHIHDICGSLILLTGDRVSLVHSTARE